MGSPELLVINTSPSPSGGGLNFVKGVSELPMDVIIKAKNINWPNYNCSFFITLFRKLREHTPYRIHLQTEPKLICEMPTARLGFDSTYRKQIRTKISREPEEILM